MTLVLVNELPYPIFMECIYYASIAYGNNNMTEIISQKEKSQTSEKTIFKTQVSGAVTEKYFQGTCRQLMETCNLGVVP